MSYKVVVTASAEKAINKLPANVQDRIFDKLESIGKDPKQQGVKKLKSFSLSGLEAASYYRARVGDYRIIYSIQEAIVTITVVKVGHRKDVYE